MTKNIVGHLKKDIRTSIIKDVLRVVKFHENTKIGGYHSVPRLVFCYIDYLGGIVYGKASTISAIKYIENYFPAKSLLRDFFNKYIK